jgi:heme o synthase
MQYMKAYSELGKLKLSSLVVATTAAGYIAAGPIPFEYNLSIFTATIIGTSFCSCCASGYNQIYEISRDKQMKRTQGRPLVTGILTPSHATMVTSLWGILGTATLYHYTDPLTTALGLGNIVLYAGVYTPLKPLTIYNTWVGAIVGAIPPLMGYTAAKHILHTHSIENLTESSSSSLLLSSTAVDILSAPTTHLSGIPTELWSSLITDPIAISLVSILYFWQLPHFMALSYMYRIDYKRGGFQMVPTVIEDRRGAKTNDDFLSEKDLGSNDITIQTDSAGLRTSNIILRYAWYLSMVPIFSTVMDVTSSMYLFESILLNAYALRVAYKFRDQQTNQNARNVFLTSLWYLPCTLMLFLLHSKAWDDTATAAEPNTNTNMLTQFVSGQIHSIRSKGRELCIHEQAIVKNAETLATRNTKALKANGSIDGNITKDDIEIDDGGTSSEASCPVMIVRKTDPNNIHLNHHPATSIAMAAPQQSSSPHNE